MNVKRLRQRRRQKLLQIVQRKRERIQQIDTENSPLLSLLELLNVPPYHDMIKRLGLLPFCLQYSTTLQEQYYEAIPANNRVIISIDAIDQIFEGFGPTPKLIVVKNPHLYVAVMVTEKNEYIPLTQLITDDHTVDTIGSWLNTWVENKSVPNEVIVNDSKTRINAAVSAFTKFNSLEKYVNNSFLNLDTSSSTPNECFIRINTTSFTEKLLVSNCFENVDEEVKLLYVTSLQRVQASTNYDTIKKIIADVITLCLNRYEYRCQAAETRLKRLIEETDLDTVYAQIPAIQNPQSEHLDNEQRTCYSLPRQNELETPAWFSNQIITERIALLTCNEEPQREENAYYLPELIPKLAQLVCILPLWSNVMVPVYSSDYNHTNVEQNMEHYLKAVKQELCQGSKLAIVNFLIRHTELIGEEMKKYTS